MRKKLFALLLVSLLGCMFFAPAYAAGDLGDYWSERRSNVTEELGYMHLDKNESYEGQASMRVYFQNGYTSNTYVKLESSQSISFDPDKTYLFECYAKSYRAGSKMFGKLVWDWTALGNIDVSDTEWTYFSRTFKPSTTSNKFGIVFENQCNGWIDNLSIRVLDDEGNPTGANLLQNGGFEMGDFEPPANVTDFDTQGLDGSVILSWRTPADEDLSAINIYEFNEEAESLVATVTPEGETSELRIDNLENGNVYYYRICAQDLAYNESAGIEIYGAPIIDEYYTEPIIAEAGSERIESLQQGDITLSTTVANNRGGNDFTAALITAVYDGMRLTEFKISQAVIPENESARLENMISIPEAHENFRVESYLWSDTVNMESLGESRILEN